MAHLCENCKFRAHYDRKPNSLLGRFWRWHINFCPGWKGYFTSLSDEQKDMLDGDIKNKVCAAASALTIVELPASDEITAESEEAITGARTAFDGLTPAQQALVPQATKDTLVAAETTLTIVKLPDRGHNRRKQGRHFGGERGVRRIER